MARTNYSFEKRQRELAKKKKMKKTKKRQQKAAARGNKIDNLTPSPVVDDHPVD